MKSEKLQIINKIFNNTEIRYNMTDVKVALTNLGEIVTRKLAKKYKPQGRGITAEVTRDDLEIKTLL